VTSARPSSSAPRSPLRLAHALSRAAIGSPSRRSRLLVASLVLRAIVVGRGSVRQPVRVHAPRSRPSILGGYLLLQRRYPIRQIGFIPTGVALALLLYATSLPSDIEPLVPALQFPRC
jgi:hypothetical protein